MVTVEDEREKYGEQWLQSLTWFHDRVVFLVWSERDNGARLIPCRYPGAAGRISDAAYPKRLAGQLSGLWCR